MTELNITSPVTATQAVDNATAGAFSAITPSVLYNNFVQLDATGKLPPVDGSQLKSVVISQSVQQLLGSGGGFIPLLVAPFALTVVRVVLIPTKTTTGSDGSNHWIANVVNKTQADAALKAANKSTNGAEFDDWTYWDVGLDQNLNIVANDVLQGQIAKVGSPTSLTSENFTWIVDYYKSA